jgi:hypothetical protein
MNIYHLQMYLRLSYVIPLFTCTITLGSSVSNAKLWETPACQATYCSSVSEKCSNMHGVHSQRSRLQVVLFYCNFKSPNKNHIIADPRGLAV